MSKYQVIVMGFDGEYRREHPEFETIEQANDYSNNLGSKWFFYPFQMIVKGQTVIDDGADRITILRLKLLTD